MADVPPSDARRRKVSILHYVLLALLSVLWGTSFRLIKIAASAFDPFVFASARLTIAAAALAPMALVGGWRWPREKGQWRSLTALALVGQAAPMLLLAAAARLTTSADLAMTMGAAPIATMLAARAFSLGEVWSVNAAFGLALGPIGLAIAMAAPIEAALYPEAALGRALGLAAAVFYACGALISRSASREVGATMAAAASMPLSAAVLLIAGFAVDGCDGLEQWSRAAWGPIAAVIALGCVSTALAYLVYFRLVMIAGATFAALNNFLVPFVGLVLGASALCEPAPLASWAGLGRVVAGVALTGASARLVQH